MKKAKIRINDNIGRGYITANDIIQSFDQLEAQGIEADEVQINTAGGSVFEALEIFNFLKTKKIRTVVTGIAASSGSIIALAGSPRVMYKYTNMLIHNATLDPGPSEAKQLKNAGINAETINNQIIQLYVDNTKLSREKIVEMMAAEKLMSAEEAKKFGFIDKIEEPTVENQLNYVAYYVNIEDDQSNKEDSEMNKALLKFFGLAENATDQQITDKLTSIKNELKLDENATLDTVMAAMKKAGTEAGDGKPEAGKESDLEKTVNELKTKFATLETTSATDKAQNLIDGAVAEGKILPADKDIWLNNAKADYAGTKTKLDAKAKNSAVPGKIEVKEQDGKENKDSASLVKNAADFIKEARAEKK